MVIARSKMIVLPEKPSIGRRSYLRFLMVDSDDGERHSQAESAAVIADPDELARAEARNALRQFDLVLRLIDEWLQTPERKFRLRPSMILQIHREALEGLSSYAGNYRPGGVEIRGSKHEPRGAHLVPELVEDMCDFVNENWDVKSPVFLASYVMWRLNWIHPFSDGNGRTSRALSYLVLCIKLGYRLPGTNTIPEQIAKNKTPYYAALERADKECESEIIDVSCMEELIANYLAAQLVDVYHDANGEEYDNGGHVFH